jgi:hypothetical protein
MSMRNASQERTICEVLREINDLHQGDSEHDIRIRLKLSEAEKMAKRMSLKLLEYNKQIFKDWWSANPEHEKRLRDRLGKGYKAE